eukprot:Anaeramoba_ignava/a89913_64.p2 GENE.a89913_64~~a89913_64.p2  ORF type:complete len:251 (+),score=54.62 a89913_64:48-755(+)
MQPSGQTMGNSYRKEKYIGRETNDEEERETDDNFLFEDATEYGVFIRDVARGVSDDEFRKAFEQIGPVFSAKVVRDKLTGRTRGFGFVRFVDKDSVMKAVALVKKPLFQDDITGRFQEVQINLIDPKNKLFIGKIPRHLQGELAKKEVEKLAGVPIEKFELATNGEGKSKSYGWATFKTNKLASQGLKNITRSAALGISNLFASFAQIKTQDPRILYKLKKNNNNWNIYLKKFSF